MKRWRLSGVSKYMNTKKICITALGVALYVCVSMLLKIPLIAHISFDLGYIVLAVYCYHFGALPGAVVGGGGAVLVSLLASGWFPPGWMLGNVAIGYICGSVFATSKDNVAECVKTKILISNIVTAFISVIIGIWIIKTVIEVSLYGVPVSVKLLTNGVAALTDAIVMCVGVIIAEKLSIKKHIITENA